MMSIVRKLKNLLPLSFKNWINDKRLVLYFLFNTKSLTSLGYQEMMYSKVFNTLKKKYSSFLDSLHYDYPDDMMPPKIVWWCWLQGEENAPAICKSCLASIRRHLPDYDVRVITKENMFDWVSPPKHIMEKYKKGIIDNTKLSNIIRTLLMVEYGGVWMDSTVFVTGYNYKVFEEPFFMFQHWKFDIEESCVASHWLISSCKGHPIMRTMLDLQYQYWRDFNKSINYLFFYFLLHLVADKYKADWQKMPRYSNISATILQYELASSFDAQRFEQIKGMSDFHKLSWKLFRERQDHDIEGTLYEHICNLR